MARINGVEDPQFVSLEHYATREELNLYTQKFMESMTEQARLTERLDGVIDKVDFLGNKIESKFSHMEGTLQILVLAKNKIDNTRKRIISASTYVGGGLFGVVCYHFPFIIKWLNTIVN